MQKSATVALISDNKLLLLKRGDTAPWMPNKYCLPGGGVDKNESLIEAAIRELVEETSIVLNSNQLTPLTISYPKYSKVVFVCNNDNNYSVQLNWEHSDYIWVSYKESSQADLVPGLDVTIKSLCHWGYLI
jgi:8-oxo-dGTP pyrophosphatase MutT (NUDIX family)